MYSSLAKTPLLTLVIDTYMSCVSHYKRILSRAHTSNTVTQRHTTELSEQALLPFRLPVTRYPYNRVLFCFAALHVGAHS